MTVRGQERGPARRAEKAHGRIRLAIVLCTALLCLPGCSEVAAHDPFELSRDTPVVIVLIDTLRADHLSCYGYPLPTSPVLDEFASRSYLFEANSTQCNSTFPAITSIFTGVYPKTHGGYLAVPLQGTSGGSLDLTCAAERFQEEGYHTSAVGSHPAWGENHDPESFLWQGWDAISMIGEPIPVEQRPRMARQSYTNERVFAALDNYDREHASAPLFLWAHYFDPHTDLLGNLYDPPAETRNVFLEHHFEKLGLGEFASELRPLDPLERQTWIAEDAPRKRRKELRLAVGRAGYDAEILSCDAGIETLFERLERSGVLDRALVIVLADHGENMELPSAERDAKPFTHGRLYDGVIHTPLMIHMPGQTKGQRISAITQNIDLFPTLMELFDMAPEAQFEGQSLVPLMRGNMLELHDTVFAESSAGREKTVRSPELKLITGHTHEQREVYAWREDPGEQSNLASAFGEDSPADLLLALQAFRPEAEIRIRCTPMSTAYEVRLEWHKRGVKIIRVEGVPESSVSEDGSTFAWSGTVPTTGLEIVLHPRDYRNATESQWTIAHSARSDLPEAVHLGRTPVCQTPAIPIWELSTGARPAQPAYIIENDDESGRIRVELTHAGARRMDCELRYTQPKHSARFSLMTAAGFAERQPPSPHYFRADAFDTDHAVLELSASSPEIARHVLLRIDGRWPDPSRLMVDGQGVVNERLRFLFPGYPHDGRIVPYFRSGPGPATVYSPGSIVIWQQTGGQGGEIDASGMSAELARQLNSIGYLGESE